MPTLQDASPAASRGWGRGLTAYLLSLSPAQADRLFLLLALLFTGAQTALVLLSPFDLAPDEAHYWEWSRRLDYNYYSKGPVVAFLIYLSTSLLGHTASAVRLPALICSALFSVLLYLFVRRIGGAQLALCSFLALRCTVFFFVLGLVITTDPPLVACWIAWLWCGYEAVRGDNPRWWLPAGAVLGCAILSKFTALILVPSLLLFLALTPARRRHLLSGWFLAGLLLVALSLLPMLAWNLRHGWVTVAHNASHLGARAGFRLAPQYLVELLGAQAGLIGPVLLVLASAALYRVFRRRQEDCGLAFLAFAALPLALLVLALSLTKRVYANWPVPVFLSAVPLAVLWLGDARRTAAYGAWFGRSLLLNGALMIIALTAVSGIDLGLPAERSPMKKLVGWSELGVEASRRLASLPDQVFVLADDYGIASELAFYMESHPQVYCLNSDGRRMNQYDIWGGLAELAGRDALIVRKGEEIPPAMSAQFGAIEPLGPPLEIRFHGEHLRSFRFYLGRRFAPQPRPVTRY